MILKIIFQPIVLPRNSRDPGRAIGTMPAKPVRPADIVCLGR